MEKEKKKITVGNNVYSTLLAIDYSENPTDFPLVRVLFTNLVLANATYHTQSRCQQFENDR